MGRDGGSAGIFFAAIAGRHFVRGGGGANQCRRDCLRRASDGRIEGWRDASRPWSYRRRRLGRCPNWKGDWISRRCNCVHCGEGREIPGPRDVLALSDGPLAEQVQDLTERKGVDVVLDTVGGDVTGQALSSLASFGRLVHLGYSAGKSLKIDSLDLISKPCTILGFNIFLVPAERSAKDVDDVMALAAKKKYRAVVD